jgi:two-component sensor histidine kinase
MQLRLIFVIQVCMLMGFLAKEGVAQNPNLQRLQKAQRMEKVALANNDSLLLAQSYYRYGLLHQFAGQNLLSKDYYLKSLRILQPKGDSYELGRVYLRLSESLKINPSSTEAIQYIQLALGIFQRINSLQGMARAYAALGGEYHKRWSDPGVLKSSKTKYDSIYFCFNKVRELGGQLKDTLLIGEGNLRLGNLFITMQDKKAIAHFRKAVDLFTLKRNDTARIHAMIDMALAYMTFQKLDSAYLQLSNAKKIYDHNKFNEHEMLLHLYVVSVDYYSRIGDWKNAYESLRQYWHHNETQKGDQDGTIALLNMKYETERKELLLKNQQQEITLRTENERNQQRFLVITLALLLVAVGATVAFYRLYRKNQRISRQNEELVKEQNHRVKNNLQVVSSLLNLQARQLTDAAAKRAVTDSQLRIQSMAILHRRLYDGEELAKVNLPEFIQELVQGVLKTFGYQFVTPKFAIDAIHLHADKAVPLGLIINELVTNACKYAFPYTDNPMLEISCQQKENKLHLEVADNGPGWNEPFDGEGRVVISKKSFGMKLIKSQAEQLNATYEFEQEGGTVFRMMFKV